MPDLILGVHAGINATAAIGDASGIIRHCVQEERLTGEKGYIGFPHHAISACLAAVRRRKPSDIAVIGYGSRSGPLGHCSQDELAQRLSRFHQLRNQPGNWSRERRMTRRRPDGIRTRLARFLNGAGLGEIPVRCYDHHTAHGAAAYYGLRHDPATPYLVVTCDGFGDGACATLAAWQDGARREIARTGMRDSLGLLYFWTTHAAGFRPHQDEYKLMGMAPYASPRRAADVAAIYHRFLGLDTGSLKFARSTRLSTELSWPRLARELRGRRFDHIFGGLQQFTEELLTQWIENAVAATRAHPRPGRGGGVFMNVKASQRIAGLPAVTQFEVFPSCGDESLAIGACYLAAAERYGSAGVPALPHCYLGDDITSKDAQAALDGQDLIIEQPAGITQSVAQLLAGGEIVARCAGPMEFGARALGNRSILADPAKADLPRILNQLIKRRDFWMPFAPAILASRQHEYIDNPKQLRSPYMMLAFPARAAAVHEFIAAVHPADLTSRAQIVPDELDCGLRDILRCYAARTGRAVLLNTSLNLHGEPIARTAADAVRVLQQSGLRYLQLGPYLVQKKT